MRLEVFSILNAVRVASFGFKGTQYTVQWSYPVVKIN